MAIKSFKKFIKTSVVLPVETIPFPRKKSLNEKYHEKTDKAAFGGDTYKKGIGKQWADRYQKTREDIHSRLSDHYNIDEDDKHHVTIFTDFSKNINQHLIKKNKPEAETSKPEKKDPEKEAEDKIVSDNIERHIKGLDNMLGQHTSPSAPFHVYTGLKRSPSELHKQHTGEEHDGASEFEAVFHHFASTSVDPEVAKQFAVSGVARRNMEGIKGRDAHIIKLKIPAKSKHGAYVGHISEYPEEKEFILKRDRKMKIHPEPEIHDYNDKMNKTKHKLYIWHGELQG